MQHFHVMAALRRIEERLTAVERVLNELKEGGMQITVSIPELEETDDEMAEIEDGQETYSDEEVHGD